MYIDSSVNRSNYNLSTIAKASRNIVHLKYAAKLEVEKMRTQKTLSDIVQELTGKRGAYRIEFGNFHPECQVFAIKRFPSKKNRVFHVKTVCGDAVLKLFVTGNASNEFNVLKETYHLRLNVPEPYTLFDNLLFMEYVEGLNMCDVLNDSLQAVHAVKLAEWFTNFHEVFRKDGVTLVKSDAILKNFLKTERGIIGLDFEFAHLGNPVEDIGEMCAHILDTNPMFTPEKYNLCRVFSETYHKLSSFSLSGLVESTAQALEAAANFRPGQRETLLKKASEIRAKGDSWLDNTCIRHLKKLNIQ